MRRPAFGQIVMVAVFVIPVAVSAGPEILNAALLRFPYTLQLASLDDVLGALRALAGS